MKVNKFSNIEGHKYTLILNLIKFFQIFEIKIKSMKIKFYCLNSNSQLQTHQLLLFPVAANLNSPKEN